MQPETWSLDHLNLDWSEHPFSAEEWKRNWEVFTSEPFLARHNRATFTAFHHRMRVLIQRGTWKAFERGWYTSASGRKVSLLNLGRGILDSSVLVRESCVPPQKPFAEGTKVSLFQGDCIEAAQAMLLEPGVKRVGVLNMACAVTPGGGYRGGAGSQEENLCRRSNLWAALESEHCKPMYPSRM